jgi:small GTP-binding protein
MKADKIVVLGDSGVGKTSIINKLVDQNSSVSDQPTVGIDFVSTNVATPNGNIRLQIWDTAGQEQYKSLIPSYLRGSTIAILVYSVDSVGSFKDLTRWINFLQETADPRLIVAGNKTDLTKRSVSQEEGQQFADSVSARFVETSALNGQNIDKLLDEIVTTPIGTKPTTTRPIVKEPTEIPTLASEEKSASSKGSCGC